MSKTEVSKLISELKNRVNSNSRMILFVREGENVLEEVEPNDPKFKYIINEYTTTEISTLLLKNGWEIELMEVKDEIDDPYSLAKKILVVIANRKQ